MKLQNNCRILTLSIISVVCSFFSCSDSSITGNDQFSITSSSEFTSSILQLSSSEISTSSSFTYSSTESSSFDELSHSTALSSCASVLSSSNISSSIAQISSSSFLTSSSFELSSSLNQSSSAEHSSSVELYSSSTLRSSSSITTGTLTDNRDSKEYSYVEIGSQVWMAQNLNYEADGSWCYYDIPSNCDTYGRLYTWDVVMEWSSASTANPSGVRGICPSGWHLPSNAEWLQLMTYVDSNNGSEVVAASLMSATGWSGTNLFGFSALPGGLRYSTGLVGYKGRGGYWWSTTEDISDDNRAIYCNINSDQMSFTTTSYLKNLAYSVRCIKD